MCARRQKDPREGVVFGLLLALAGVVFLLDRMDVIYVGHIWHWWPFIVIGMGLFKVLLWHSAEAVGSGMSLMMFGFWFLVSERGWFGLDWSSSWPLALVAVGLSMVVRAALTPLFRGPTEDAPRGGGTDA